MEWDNEGGFWSSLNILHCNDFRQFEEERGKWMISVSVVICDFPDEGSLLVWICLELLWAELWSWLLWLETKDIRQRGQSVGTVNTIIVWLPAPGLGQSKNDFFRNLEQWHLFMILIQFKNQNTDGSRNPINTLFKLWKSSRKSSYHSLIC